MVVHRIVLGRPEPRPEALPVQSKGMDSDPRIRPSLHESTKGSKPTGGILFFQNLDNLKMLKRDAAFNCFQIRHRQSFPTA